MALTKVTYSMITGAPVLVDDFIPAGVNTETTNVSSYIQNAINSLPVANSGIRGHLAFSNKRYYLGAPTGATPAVLVDRPMLISGNGATLFVAGAATGRVWRINAPFVTMQNIVFTKDAFSLTSTADLTGEALSMYANITRPCQKWQLSNVEITGFQYGIVFSGEGAGCAYGDVYSPRIRFTAYGMVFDSANSDPSYCTDINVFGGELSLDGFGAYTNSRGIDIRNTNSFHANNGINFYGTNVEGHWIRKLRCEGQDCSFNDLYWDATNGGTDIEFVNNISSGQIAKNNLIVGGSPLWQQTIVNTGGNSNSLIDPTKGIGFGNPVLASNIAFQYTQVSASGGGISGVIANSANPLANNSAALMLQSKKANGTLVNMAAVDGQTVDPTGEGHGRIGLYARSSSGYGYPVAFGDGDTGNFYPGVDNTGSCGTASYRWSVVYAATGTINTSDFNAKQDIQSLSDAEKRVALAIKSSIKKFRFKDAVEKKGENARIHFGVIAQEVKTAFEAQGLDASKYGIFCSDTLEDGSERLGVRYEELLAFVIAAM